MTQVTGVRGGHQRRPTRTTATYSCPGAPHLVLAKRKSPRGSVLALSHGLKERKGLRGPISAPSSYRQGSSERRDLAKAAWMRREGLQFDARAWCLPALSFGCSSNNPGGYSGRSGSSSPPHPHPHHRLEQCKGKCRF